MQEEGKKRKNQRDGSVINTQLNVDADIVERRTGAMNQGMWAAS